MDHVQLLMIWGMWVSTSHGCSNWREQRRQKWHFSFVHKNNIMVFLLHRTIHNWTVYSIKDMHLGMTVPYSVALVSTHKNNTLYSSVFKAGNKEETRNASHTLVYYLMFGDSSKGKVAVGNRKLFYSLCLCKRVIFLLVFNILKDNMFLCAGVWGWGRICV